MRGSKRRGHKCFFIMVSFFKSSMYGIQWSLTLGGLHKMEGVLKDTRGST